VQRDGGEEDGEGERHPDGDEHGEVVGLWDREERPCLAAHRVPTRQHVCGLVLAVATTPRLLLHPLHDVGREVPVELDRVEVEPLPEREGEGPTEREAGGHHPEHDAVLPRCLVKAQPAEVAERERVPAALVRDLLDDAVQPVGERGRPPGDLALAGAQAEVLPRHHEGEVAERAADSDAEHDGDGRRDQGQERGVVPRTISAADASG
jgi:hypothetical protein